MSGSALFFVVVGVATCVRAFMRVILKLDGGEL